MQPKLTKADRAAAKRRIAKWKKEVLPGQTKKHLREIERRLAKTFKPLTAAEKRDFKTKPSGKPRTQLKKAENQ